MGTALVLGALLGVVGILLFGVMAIGNRADMAKRRRWNAWVLGSFAFGALCLLLVVVGIR